MVVPMTTCSFPGIVVGRLALYLAWRAGNPTKPVYKDHEYRMPADGHGPSSQWAGFVEWLWDRYAHRLAAFEVVNEPNGQLWPRRTPIDTEVFEERWGTAGTSLVSAQATAEMIATVDAIARRYPDGPLLLAPSTSDTLQAINLRHTTISHTNRHVAFFDPFVESLLPALDQRGFVADDRWIWSFHNYTDTERRYRFSTHLRQILTEHGSRGRQPTVGRSCGRPRRSPTGRDEDPFRGPRRPRLDPVRLDYQARVITESLSRHHYARAPCRIGMVTQYTTYADDFNRGSVESERRPATRHWPLVRRARVPRRARPAGRLAPAV